MPDVAPERFDVRELIAEARREAAMRRTFYGKRVRAGLMRQEDADRRIELMDAIVRRLTRTAAI